MTSELFNNTTHSHQLLDVSQVRVTLRLSVTTFTLFRSGGLGFIIEPGFGMTMGCSRTSSIVMSGWSSTGSLEGSISGSQRSMVSAGFTFRPFLRSVSGKFNSGFGLFVERLRLTKNKQNDELNNRI